MPERRRHLPALDGLRGLAILLVVVHHAFLAGRPAPTGLDEFAFLLAGAGWCGVDLFFVLSGFLITGILRDGRDAPHRTRDFYVRRTLRIVPLYYLVLGGLFLLGPAVGPAMVREYVASSSGDQVWFWTYLTNWRIGSQDAFYPYLVPNVFWSLAIEEQFYLVWPVLAWRCSSRTLWRLCLAGIVGSVALRGWLSLAHQADVAAFVLTPARVDALLLGALVALALRRDDLDRARLRAGARRAALVGGLLLTGVVARTASLDWRHPLVITLGLSAMALLFTALLTGLVLAPRGARWTRLVDNRPLRLLGTLSYGIYLFHGPLGSAVQRTLLDPAGATGPGASGVPLTLLYTGLVLGVSVAVAWTSWHLFEKHLLELKRHFGG